MWSNGKIEVTVDMCLRSAVAASTVDIRYWLRVCVCVCILASRLRVGARRARQKRHVGGDRVQMCERWGLRAARGTTHARCALREVSVQQKSRGLHLREDVLAVHT